MFGNDGQTKQPDWSGHSIDPGTDGAELIKTGPDQTVIVNPWERYLASEEMREGGEFALVAYQAGSFTNLVLSFAREVFSELYSSESFPVDEGDEGEHGAAIAKLWGAVRGLEGWGELRELCAGESHRTGMAAAEYIQQIADEFKNEEKDQNEETAASNVAARLMGEYVNDEGDKVAPTTRASAADAVAKAKGKVEDLIKAEKVLATGQRAGETPGTPIAKAPTREIVNAMRRNPKFRKVMEIVGRMRPVVRSIRHKVRVDWMNEEVIGAQMGGDISRLLSSEMVAFADPDLELDLLRRVTESSIMETKTQGFDDAGKGPVIFCLDESGSMSGDPDTWAKAVAVAMAEVAMRERRPFALIHFDDGIHDVDFVRGRISIKELVGMISKFANGGTSFTQPLERALDIIEDEKLYGKSDIVFLTDGQARVAPATKQRVIDSDVRLHVFYIRTRGTGDLDEIADSTAQITDLNPSAIESMGLAFQAI